MFLTVYSGWEVFLTFWTFWLLAQVIQSVTQIDIAEFSTAWRGITHSGLLERSVTASLIE